MTSYQSFYLNWWEISIFIHANYKISSKLCALVENEIIGVWYFIANPIRFQNKAT